MPITILTATNSPMLTYYITPQQTNTPCLHYIIILLHLATFFLILSHCYHIVACCYLFITLLSHFVYPSILSPFSLTGYILLSHWLHLATYCYHIATYYIHTTIILQLTTIILYTYCSYLIHCYTLLSY